MGIVEELKRKCGDIDVGMGVDIETLAQSLVGRGALTQRLQQIVSKLREPTDTQRDSLDALSDAKGNLNVRPAPIDLTNIVMKHPDTNVVLQHFSGRFFGKEIDFSGSVFFQISSFSNAVFEGDVQFQDCIFLDSAWFDGVEFKGSVSFSGCIFNRNAHFQDAVFEQSLNFSECVFLHYVSFFKTRFLGGVDARSVWYHGDVDFTGAIFKEAALFEGNTFNKSANFEGAHFEGAVLLKGITCDELPNFASCIFKQVPASEHLQNIQHALSGVFLDKNTKNKRPIWELDINSSDKLRYLRQLCSDANDHEREAFYFAYEMKAHRLHRVHSSMKWIYWLYEFVSGYGRSVWRPAVGFVSVWFLGWMLIAVNGLKTNCGGVISYMDVWPFYLGNMLPFLGASYHARSSLKCADGSDVMLNGFGYFVNFGGSILAVIFIFLIGLALRNRFRL